LETACESFSSTSDLLGSQKRVHATCTSTSRLKTQVLCNLVVLMRVLEFVAYNQRLCWREKWSFAKQAVLWVQTMLYCVTHYYGTWKGLHNLCQVNSLRGPYPCNALESTLLEIKILQALQLPHNNPPKSLIHNTINATKNLQRY
jgi:hypothetical protein